mmetsp:Transcript_74641/g.230715  ORF Transcript_74641/g.230715 Transcript_74641/m.230715 type:complete len:238 (-) Transcript_74641:2780-3493(-)
MKKECRHGGRWIAPLPFRHRPAIARTREDFPMPLSPAIKRVSPSLRASETSLMRVRLGLFTCRGVFRERFLNSNTTSLAVLSTRAMSPPQFWCSSCFDAALIAVMETISSHKRSIPSCPSTLPMQSLLMLAEKELAYRKRFFDVSLSPSAMLPISTMGLYMHIRHRSRMSVYQREDMKAKKDFCQTYFDPGVMPPSTLSYARTRSDSLPSSSATASAFSRVWMTFACKFMISESQPL